MMNEDRYILFTMWRCGKCKDLKKSVSHLVANGTVMDVDVSQISPDSNMMKVFRVVSPNALVPALGIIRGQNLIGKQVGVVNIMKELHL